MYRLAVLVSGKGTTLNHLIQCCENGEIDARIKCVISNKSKAKAKIFADKANIPYFIKKNDDDIFNIIKSFKIDLVVLAGYTSLIKIPNEYENKILNIHPSLLPKFGGKGFYGLYVHESVLKAGEKQSGCTVHVIDNEYDRGIILAQSVVPVSPDDTAEKLQTRVQLEEKQLYPKVIQSFLSKGLKYVEDAENCFKPSCKTTNKEL